MPPLYAGCFFAWVLILGVTEAHSIEKRSTAYSIETRVIVDSFAVSSWKALLATSDAGSKTALQAYINSAFNDLNSILSGLSSVGIDMDARIVGIEFATGQISASSNGDIDSDKSLTDLRQWLSSKSYSKVDHTMLVTGLDLVRSGSNITAGVASLGGMCGAQNSLSVVEASPSGSVTLVMAHEIGHSLNSAHDDDDPKCSVYSYIMKAQQSSGDQTSKQNFRFSACTVSFIKTFLASGKGNCLTQTSVQKHSASPLGKLYTPDQICKMVIGQGSFFSRSRYGSQARPYSNMCLNLWCEVPGANTCRSVKAADGFVCGAKKTCFLGDCVDDTSATTGSATDSCPQGDSPLPLSYLDGQTCSQAISVDSRYCAHEVRQRSCCRSCKAIETDEKDCPYGDQSTSCNGLANYYCYANSALCCNTCRQYKTGIEGCEYGDKAPWCATIGDSDCPLNAGTCCKRCK